MISGWLLVATVVAGQTPSPARPSVAAAAVRDDKNPTVIRALEVVDSLIKHPVAPRTLRGADVAVATEQATWFKSLRDRLTTLLTMVQTPAQRVAPPAPVEDKHIKALQEEATSEAVRFTSIANVLKTRHDIAMNAIRNMK